MFEALTLIDFPRIDPVWFSIPLPFTDLEIPIRWYALSYIAGLYLAWFYVSRMVKRPGAPMKKDHVDDLLFWGAIGVIVGGRLAYVAFYQPSLVTGPDGSIANIAKTWEGGMSFHGGVLGVGIAMILYARSKGLSWMRVADYVACAVPIGLGLGHLANFINGELYGRAADVAWAMVFPNDPQQVPRHPSQLYESVLEGPVLFAILAWFFWKTDARYKPGFLMGVFLAGYGAFRFIVEYFREPDSHIGVLGWGLTTGQTLCLPMILGGLWLIWTAAGRRQRIEPISGSVAQQ